MLFTNLGDIVEYGAPVLETDCRAVHYISHVVQSFSDIATVGFAIRAKVVARLDENGSRIVKHLPLPG